MRRFALVQILILELSITSMSADHPVPTNRSELKGGDWFPYVISKIAPLESWTVEPSAAEAKVSNTSGNESYLEYRNNFWGDVPRFCFSFFRPSPERFASFLAAIENYRGPVFWVYSDSCLAPFAQRPGYISRLAMDSGSEDMSELLKKFEELQLNPPQPDPDWVKKAVADIPQFCSYLEEKLGLKDKEPQQFDPSWLTKDGLSKHPEGDDDFIEYGSWSVALTSDPEKLAQQMRRNRRQLNT